MNSIYKFILVSTLMLVSAAAFASHNQGMNISYKNVGGDTFEITIDFFRYCGGSALGGNGNPAGAGNQVNYTLHCMTTNTTISKQAPLLMEVPDSLFLTVCNAAVGGNSCPPNGSWSTGLIGIQWFIYRDTVVFSEETPSTCDQWRIYTGICCRNSGTNYSTQPGLHVEAMLRQNDFPDNSAPEFASFSPIPIFCNGSPATYNWGALEYDGDSLYWELDTAYTGFNITTGYQNMNYAFGYTGVQPITGITIDNQTGQLDFLASVPTGFTYANYAVAVRVSEYDQFTGEFKGSVHRDVQFIVLDSCPNEPPVQDTNGLSNFSGTGALIDSNTVEVCFGQSFAFDVIFTDYDTSGAISNSLLSITSNIGNVLPGAVWSHTNTNPDTVSVSWTATPIPNGFAPFNITVTDDNCPVPGFNIYTYNVYIVPSTFLGPDTSMCELDTIRLNANGGDTFSWTVIPNPGGGIGDPIVVGQNFGCDDCATPWIHPSTTTTYAVESNLSATCGNKDTITVTVFEKFNVDISPAGPYCVSDGLDTLTAVTPGGTWLGSGIVNAVAGVFAPDVVDPGFDRDTVISIIYDLQGLCANRDTLEITVKGFPDARIETTGPFCVQSTNEQLVGFNSGGTWSGQSVSSGGVFNPSAFTAPDTVTIYHTIDDDGCVFTDSASFRIIDEYNTSIDSLPRICLGEEVIIHLNDFEGDPFGTWSGSQVYEEPPGSGEFYFNTKNLKADEYTITYEITGLCGTKSDADLVISKLPDATFAGFDSVYCDNIEDSIQLRPNRPEGIWGGEMNALHDGYFVPSEVGAGVYTISYELYDTLTTCYNKEVVEVRIARTPTKPKIYGGGPYCQGHNLRGLRADGLLTNTFKWFYSEQPVSDTVLIGAGNPFDIGEIYDIPTVILATQVSEYGCESELSRVEIPVLPSPIAFFEVDTNYGTVPFELTFNNLTTPEGADHNYNWTFGTPTGVSEEFSPTFVFDEIGTYTVRLVADNEICSDTHTTVIVADQVTDFFIPNVITPNGDGQNDILTWKIEGIGEFQLTIFNRWGKKVFETDDLYGEWDGGDEPSGTFFYVMTGKEETLDERNVSFRGDITLIRD